MLSKVSDWSRLGFDIAKIVRRIAGRKGEKSPNQPGTAQHEHGEALNGEFQRHGGRLWLCRFAGKLLVGVIFVAPIGVSLEPPHHHFIGLVEDHAQKPLGKYGRGGNGFRDFVGGRCTPFDHQHESVEQVGRRLDVDDRKHRRQVDQDVVIFGARRFQRILDDRR